MRMDRRAEPTAEPIRNERIRLESSLEQLSELMRWFKRFNQRPLSEDLWIQGQTGMVEAFSNAVRHAHRGLLPMPPIIVTVALDPTNLRIEVFDQGPPYDLAAALESVEAQVTAPGFNPLAREAHWGQVLLLQLRQQHGWQITYVSRPDGGNQFCLTRPLEGVPVGGASRQ